MRIRLALTLDIARSREHAPHEDYEPRPGLEPLGAQVEQAHEHTGPSIGFRIPDAEPEWADRQASK